jgi:integrase
MTMSGVIAGRSTRRPGRGRKERGRKGEGSVRAVAGRENYYRADRTVDGHTYTATGATEVEAIATREAKIAAARKAQAGERDPRAVTVEQYTQAWLDRRKLEIGESLEQSSWDWMQRALEQHVWPAVGHLPLPDLTAEALEARYAALRQPPRPLSLGYVRKINGTLAQALRRVVRDYRIPNVALEVELPRAPRRRPQRTLSEDQLHRFWRVARSHRLYALWLLASYYPTRSGELRGFRWADFDERYKTLALQRSARGIRTAPREGGKTEPTARILELDDALHAALIEHRQHQADELQLAGKRWTERGLIFTTRTGGPLSKENLLDQFRRLLRGAGLPEHHRVHDLRHSTSHHYLRAGISLPELAGAGGWSSTAVPAEIYAGAVRRVPVALVQRLGVHYGEAPAELAALDVPRLDGQARALSAAQVAEAQRLRGIGWTQARIAERLGVATSTVNRALRGIVGRTPSKRKPAESAV